MLEEESNTHLGLLNHGRFYAEERMRYPFQDVLVNNGHENKGYLGMMYISWIKVWWYIKIPCSGNSKNIVMDIT